MSDSTLDDFFAKKDRSKKGKAKSKYTTSDTIAKKLEEGGKKPDVVMKKDVKEKIPLSSSNPSIAIPSITNEQEDDEWKNIEEKEADYSGLRIQALSISEKEKEEEQLKEQLLSEQNGESRKESDGQSGPWKVVQTPVSEIEEEEEIPSKEEPEVKEETTPASKPVGTYRPPALRNAPASTPTSGGGRRHPKNAPQISSELHFPSLSSAVDSNKWKLGESDRSFQSVKHGVRSKDNTQRELKLDLENKFSALHQNE
ncbi:protein CDV3 homolog A [Parasteatoda tepidariorum]|uniref:Protein CDV3-like protein n=1 Tax=Parasteatoda tepidariorum TaxID=114398 RepID=A0A2L2Y339_PARTP|nr:protein CDV3 homolog A [Parasteatoda tepidariorum]